MSYPVDANVWSEPTEPAPDPGALRWLREHEAETFVNPSILGELEYGILVLPPGRRRSRLETCFRSGLNRFQPLPLDVTTASGWAGVLARLKREGLAMPLKDSLIVATALQHGLSVVTRNVSDFRHAGVEIINPFGE